MRSITVVILMMGLCWGNAAALGPADGEGLPPTEPGRIAVGDLAPDFSLKRNDNSVVTLSKLREVRNVVLVFNRGHW